MNESVQDAVRQEDAVISEAMNEIMTNPEARSELADAAKEYASENPNRVGGRVVGTALINTAVTAATRGAGKMETVGDIAKAGVQTGLTGATITAIGTSGDVRQAAQNGVSDPEGFMKAFLGGETRDPEER